MTDYTTDMPRNITSGRWAVAIDGTEQWTGDSALGDGITQPSMALVTRCRTKAEALRTADRLRGAQPELLPGKGCAYSFAVMPYRRLDFVSVQDQRNPRAQQTVRTASALIP